MRYRGMVAGALVSLALAAVTSLALPLAVRRMIDHGFTQSDGSFINSYFAMLMVMAVVLAIASAMRYYFVITLGERIVADLRRDVFAHVARLSPAFFDVNQSGEIVSRLTADTTQIKSAVGATASVALRNLILCIGAMGMMIVTSPKLSSLALGAIPLIVFPLGAEALARRAGYACRSFGLRQRDDYRHAHGAGLQRRGRRGGPLRRGGRIRLPGGPRRHPFPRAADGDRHHADLRQRRRRALGRCP
jgi:ABC-type multidrug transport system fused ATPase/permease subunit